MPRTGALLVAALPASPAIAQDAGGEAFAARCAGCHGMTGQGTVAGNVPSFPGSVGRIAGYDRGRTYMLHVPGVGSASFDPAGIATVMNDVLGQWSDGSAPQFTVAEVRRRLAIDVPDVVTCRREIAAYLSARGVDIAAYPWP